MRVWTIQLEDVYDIVMKEGCYRCDGRYVDKYFKPAYQWLTKEMRHRIKKPNFRITYPIWAWHIWNDKNKKPDLRSSSFAKRGTKMVCLELEIPDNEILLSDFNAWHFVLNNWYYNPNCDCEEIWDKDDEYLSTLSPNQRQEMITDSWQHIFSIQKKNSDWFGRELWVQGTFWEIKKEYIKKATFFIAK